MSFTKAHGNRLLAILAINWLGALLLALALKAVSGRDFDSTFIPVFAICIIAVVLVLLFRKDILSSLLMIGGGLMVFALTTLSIDLLGL